jgi:hypothetical protein
MPNGLTTQDLADAVQTLQACADRSGLVPVFLAEYKVSKGERKETDF